MMEERSDVIGSVVLSLAGRDRKRPFLIVGLSEDQYEDGYVLIANGRLHPLEKPKRKNLRHLAVLKKGTAETAELLQSQNVSNELLADLLENCYPQKMKYPEGGDCSGKG